VSRGQRDGSPTAVISVLKIGAATFSSKWVLSCTHNAEFTPFQTHYFSENLVAPGRKPGTSGSVARNPIPQRRYIVKTPAEKSPVTVTECIQRNVGKPCH
jgi:hypothetical protein